MGPEAGGDKMDGGVYLVLLYNNWFGITLISSGNWGFYNYITVLIYRKWLVGVNGLRREVRVLKSPR